MKIGSMYRVAGLEIPLPWSASLRSSPDELIAGQASRTSYIGREHDKESDLGFYGVRLYEPTYGRFLSTDVLWGLYRSVQPYQYALNEPVSQIDAGGKWVEAKTPQAQEAVRNSVPTCFRDAVTFNRDGILNAGPLVEAAAGLDPESNIANLAALATHAVGIEVSVVDQVSYRNGAGTAGSVSWDRTEKQTGGMKAWLGQTLPLLSDNGMIGTSNVKAYSTSDNIQVLIRKDPPKTESTVGSTTAHELIGHARFIILCREGKASSAVHGDHRVEEAINRAEKEAKE